MISTQDYVQLAEAQKLLNWAREENTDQRIEGMLAVVYQHISDLTNDFMVAQRARTLKDDEKAGNSLDK